MRQAPLFAAVAEWPAGFTYAAEFPGAGQRATCKVDLDPRSAYQIRGAARWRWQHAVSPTRELRYSITFRTRNLRKQPAAAEEE